MKKGLGKGLNALITYDEVAALKAVAADEEIYEVDITKVMPNPGQPRKHFDESQIEELAASIKEFGIVQPLIVKKNNENYMIVAGERRWRAAQIAGLSRIPVVVREYSDMQMLEIALIENIQREDLNPIEEANCYKRLNEVFSLTHEDISGKVGKSRSHISNSIRLLRLDSRIQAYIVTGDLTVGHAKAILPIENKEIQLYFARKMVEEQLNVREAEEFVRKYGGTSGAAEARMPEKKEADKKYNHFQTELRGILSTRVNIRDNRTGNGGGKIEINYFSEEDLGRIIGLIKSSR